MIHKYFVRIKKCDFYHYAMDVYGSRDKHIAFAKSKLDFPILSLIHIENLQLSGFNVFSSIESTFILSR